MVVDGDAAAQHPTKATFFMQHAVLTLEMRSQSLLMGCNLLFDSLSISVMDPVKPFFRSDPNFAFLIAQHGLPTRGKMDNVVRQIPVPQAIVGTTSREGIALFAFLQRFLRVFV